MKYLFASIAMLALLTGCDDKPSEKDVVNMSGVTHEQPTQHANTSEEPAQKDGLLPLVTGTRTGDPYKPLNVLRAKEQ